MEEALTPSLARSKESADNLLRSEAVRDHWDDELFKACRDGGLKRAEMCVVNGARDFDGGMLWAASFGHFDCVVRMAKFGADNWNDCLVAASEMGHDKIALFCIRNGASNVEGAFYAACCRARVSTARLMMDCGAICWNLGLCGASSAGCEELVGLMLEKGADELDLALEGACEAGKPAIVRILVARGAAKCGHCGRAPRAHLGENDTSAAEQSPRSRAWRSVSM